MVTPRRAPCLIGLDWGSSSLRAWLIGADGALLDERATGQGASTLRGHDAFAAVFEAATGDWRAAWPGVPVLACGMVGSSHGWLEAPYAACPAGLDALARGLVRAGADAGAEAGPCIVPGLRFDAPGLAPDLMRGEETQIVGALAAAPAAAPDLCEASCIVLPGTHSKWAQVAGGRVTRFATWMTGELYALLRAHSVLGRLMPPQAAADAQAFRAGVEAARAGGGQGLTHQLFAVRSLGVTGQMRPEALADYLSGLLIGHELAGALAWRTQDGLAERPLALVGAPRLCERYAQALAQLGAPDARVLGNVAPAGLLAVARAAGLVPAAAHG